MMVNVNDLLSLFIYAALLTLIIIFIILGIKLIRTLKKVDSIIDDVNVKMTKVNGVFDIIDKTTDYAANISDKVISVISNFINVLLRKKKGNGKDGEE
ncbi:MAG: hypothetical protein IJY25_02690 [Bacilli bacterium]|nr:hypothetical protein [Bacilli bacterium]